MSSETTRIAPILVYIQTHLEEDLSLERLSALANLSPFHFHRLFSQTIGETVKKYTLRLRLERAAYQLKLRDCTIVEVAFMVGFRSHETFTRAFKKQFGLTPRQFRQQSRTFKFAQQPQLASIRQFVSDPSISPVRVVKLKPLPVIYERQLGPYEQVDVTAYGRLSQYTHDMGISTGSHTLLGVGHDDPQITPPEKTRFDCCLEVATDNRPFLPPDAPFLLQTLPGGTYATATISGPTHVTTYAAYGAIFQHVQTLSNYQFIGIPAVEIYRVTQINDKFALEFTEVYCPLNYQGG